MKKIIICHQYFTPEHFKALYDCAEEYGYKIDDYIVLSKRNILGSAYRKMKAGNYTEAVRGMIKQFIKLCKLNKLEGENLIVGLAPYDPMMIKYRNIFRKNACVYFTSFAGWNTEKFDRGNISLREEFIRTLKTSFIGAACVSKQTEAEVKKYFKQTSVVNHAIDAENYLQKKQYIRTKKYIFIGRVTAVKNIRLICDWFEKNQSSGAEITIVGSGDLTTYVKDCANKCRAITYAGRWTKEDIKSRLKDFDYLILPSEREPFGIVLIEALASGVPCIVSDATGPMEIINKENGIIFPLDDKLRGFDYAMQKSLTMDDDKYEALCKAALNSSTQYSSDALVGRWLKLFT